MAYIEDRIDCLEDRFCKLERQLENQHLEDRVSTLEDIVENDGRKLDELAERVSEVHGMCIHDEPQVQQTMDEFVRIVRCKDCVWYVNVHDSQIYDRCRNVDGLFDPKPDDYCMYGEKRNE